MQSKPNKFRLPSMSALAMAGLVAAALVVSSGVKAKAEEPTAKITITGSGSVSVTPDMATLVSRVVTQDDNAKTALDQNSAAMRNVMKEITAAGIEKKHIQTSGFDISPVYGNNRNLNNNGYQTPKVVGYRVQNGVSVTVTDIEKIGPLLDKVVSSGSNDVGQIRFGISEPQKHMEQARKDAVADARAKAELYAQAAGVKLGRVLSISEETSGRSPYPEMMMARAAKMDSAPPIEAGEETISASVNITYELIN